MTFRTPDTDAVQLQTRPAAEGSTIAVLLSLSRPKFMKCIEATKEQTVAQVLNQHLGPGEPDWAYDAVPPRRGTDNARLWVQIIQSAGTLQSGQMETQMQQKAQAILNQEFSRNHIGKVQIHRHHF